MITKTLLKQLCHLAKTPDSIKRIRAFVLQAAMSGRLSGMAPGDTTLGDLEQIVNAERKAGGHEKKTLKAICTSDVGMPSGSIPSHWGWYRFGDIAHHNAGKMLNKGQNNAGRETEYITTSNLYWGYFRLDGLRKMPIRDDELERCTATKGDLLICEGGEAGRAAVWPHDRLIAFQNHVHRARPFGGISPYYLQLYFWKLEATGEIAKHRKGVGITSMSGKTLSEILIPLPPLAEQKRIVAKVDELMALCDRLEAQLKERDVKQAALAKAALAKFTEDPSQENLQLLFHPSFTIEPEDLRESILSLAVKGELAPQNPNDEPAEQSISRLGLKNSLVPPHENHSDNEPLPSGWVRVKFEDIALVAGGVTLGRKLGDRKTVTLPYLRVANVKRGKIDLSVVKQVTIAEDEIQRYALRENDLLMTEGGDWDTVGRAAIWRCEIPRCLHQNHIFRARMRSNELMPFWLERYLNSPAGRRYFESASKQTTNLASINMRQVRSCPIPLPPVAEQRRIVAKVEQLLTLVDTLESQLEASRMTGEKLLEAMVAELTAD